MHVFYYLFVQVAFNGVLFTNLSGSGYLNSATVDGLWTTGMKMAS
jgi:hypothetical protein